jgi:hypothetical protein
MASSGLNRSGVLGLALCSCQISSCVKKKAKYSIMASNASTKCETPAREDNELTMLAYPQSYSETLIGIAISGAGGDETEALPGFNGYR